MRRELRSVQTDEVVGAVVADGTQRLFEGQAGEVLSRFRRLVGDTTTIDVIMVEGWSNGYLYFAEATP